MTKVLNLDELETTIEKVIVLNGVEYAMKPFSVEEFINQMKEITAATDESMTGVDLYKLTLRMIRRAFPGLTDEAINKLSTFQIDAIHKFLKATAEDELERAPEIEPGKDEGEASS